MKEYAAQRALRLATAMLIGLACAATARRDAAAEPQPPASAPPASAPAASAPPASAPAATAPAAEAPPASAPAASAPPASAPPASAPPAASSSETIDDPDDTDDFPADMTPAAPVSAAPSPAAAARSVEPPVQWAAHALLRAAFDLRYEGGRGAAAGGFAEDVAQLVGQAFGELHYRPRSDLRIKLGLQLDYWLTSRLPGDPATTYALFNGNVHRNDFAVLARDSYIELSRSWLDLQAGMITTVWGGNDLANPNDVLTAHDLRYGPLVTPEAARLPSLTFKADVYLARFQLTALWQPVHRAHRLEAFGSDFALLGAAAPRQLRGLGELLEQLVDDSVEGTVQPAVLQTSSPRPFAQGNAAVRLARTLGGWDVALQYAYLYERIPRIRVRQDFALAALLALGTDGQLTENGRQQLGRFLLQAPLPVDMSYRRQHQVGASVATGVGPFVTSLDLSYMTRRALALGGELPFISRGEWLDTFLDSDVVAYTVGARYVRGEEFLLSLEWWHQLLLEPLGRDAAQRPELLLGGPHLGGLAMLLQVRLARYRTTLQFLAHVDVFNGSLIVTPQVGYRASDHVELVLGVNVFEGGSRSAGGLFDANDQLFVELHGYL